MKDSSNSSVNELIEAVGALSGDTYSSKRNDYNGVGWFDNTYIAGDNPSGMDFAQIDAYNIAMTFNESNTDLYNAWQSVSDCLEKISKKMHEEVCAFADELFDFAEKTLSNEIGATEAANQAVAASEEILNQLNINN